MGNVMTKYYSKNCKYILAAMFFGLAVLLIGIVACIVFNNELFELKLFLILFGAVITLITIPTYFAEKSRWIAIHNDELLLPKGVQIVELSGNKSICMKRISLSIKEIKRVTKEFRKGDKIVLGNTYFYFLKQ